MSHLLIMAHSQYVDCQQSIGLFNLIRMLLVTHGAYRGNQASSRCTAHTNKGETRQPLMWPMGGIHTNITLLNCVENCVRHGD